MAAATLRDFVKSAPPAEFRAEAKYYRDGDFVAVFVKDAQHYAQRIDEVLTIYREEGTDELVGCKIKSVTFLIKRFGDFAVEVEEFAESGKGVRMALFFMTAATLAESSRRRHYVEAAQKLKDKYFDLSEVKSAA